MIILVGWQKLVKSFFAEPRYGVGKSSKLRARADAIILACARVLMELRSGIYKGVHGVLNPSHRRQFEEGVNLLFSSWTALCLAIDNEWGGPASRQKAEQLYQDVLCWFYGHTGSFAQPPVVEAWSVLLTVQ